MRASHPSSSLLAPALFVVVTVVVAFRLWTSFGFFPFADWNEVRLAPTFMLWHGFTPYPGLDRGPLTTWIYGPVPLLLNLPAVFARDAVGAMLIAGTINLLIAVVPTALVVFGSPAPHAIRADRRWALLLCLALWPNSSLQYIQADNAAVAFGMLSTLLLLSRSPGSVAPLLAGLCAALAVWSKQTALAIIPAQLLWLALTGDARVALRHAAICAAAGLLLGGGFVAGFGFEGLWLNLVRLPGQLPFAGNFLGRTRELWLQLLGYVALPAVGLIIARRIVFRRDSPWLLPTLTWLFLLPTALISVYKVGGASNSLNGVLYLLPLAGLFAVGWLRRLHPRTSVVAIAAGILAVLLQQLSSSPLLPLRPLTTHLVVGADLAQKFPGRIYFPWHPLLTFYGERRFYHVEDGLSTRRFASLERPPSTTRLDLPASWSITAIPGWREQGVYRELQPLDAQLGFVGKWSVFSWPAKPEPAPP